MSCSVSSRQHQRVTMATLLTPGSTRSKNHVSFVTSQFVCLCKWQSYRIAFCAEAVAPVRWRVSFVYWLCYVVGTCGALCGSRLTAETASLRLWGEQGRRKHDTSNFNYLFIKLKSIFGYAASGFWQCCSVFMLMVQVENLAV